MLHNFVTHCVSRSRVTCLLPCVSGSYAWGLLLPFLYSLGLMLQSRLPHSSRCHVSTFVMLRISRDISLLDAGQFSQQVPVRCLHYLQRSHMLLPRARLPYAWPAQSSGAWLSGCLASHMLTSALACSALMCPALAYWLSRVRCRTHVLDSHALGSHALGSHAPSSTGKNK